jgi:thymidine phosphorylase
MPVGRSAKVRSPEAAQALMERLQVVGRELGIAVQVLMTDGSQPVGRGIGPALEAWDVLGVLQNAADAPDDLRRRALMLAAAVLEMGGKAGRGAGMAMAGQALASGAAWRKFQAICDAQGGMREPPRAPFTHVVEALHGGRVTAIDNRRLATAAKLAGAPRAAAAGIAFHAPLGRLVSVGQPLFTLHAASPGELAYALAYVLAQEALISIKES